MSDNKDYIDRIIDLFCESYYNARKEPYSIGRGKKHYYNSIERQYVVNLISIYKQSKPDADTETALSDFQKLFDVIMNHKYESPYLSSVTLFKVCYKLNDYKNYIQNKHSKKEFNEDANTWYNSDKTSNAVAILDNKVSKITKLPEIDKRYYTEDEETVIKEELLRFARARDENYSPETVNEWIRCFSELNYTVSKVVKCIRLAKLQPKYKTKEFAMFLQVDLNEYYRKYLPKKNELPE